MFVRVRLLGEQIAFVTSVHKNGDSHLSKRSPPLGNLRRLLVTVCG